jgi:hypothetical protein
MTDQQVDTTIQVKNLHRATNPKTPIIFNSKYGAMAIEIRKAKGMTIFEIWIDGRYTGLNEVSALEAHESLSEYLSVPLEEMPRKGKKVTEAVTEAPVKKITGQRNWSK